MATEIEMKLRVPDEKTLDRVLSDPDITQYMRDDLASTHMSSTYYDTPDGVLEAHRWTLRLRQEGSSSIAAFKTANTSDGVGFFTRNEWQCTSESIEDAIPLLIDQGAPRDLKMLLKGKTLTACCGAEFDRRSACLYMADGVRIELAGDLGYLFSGDHRAPICELELELMYGDASSLPPICDQLVGAYGLTEESVSKYQRARALGQTL